VACAALPDTLIEDELFGHEKGAFTDARRYRKGRFEMADGGTIFLDEVDDLPLPIQVKLLRVIQERSFERIGGEKQVTVDVRIVAATKVDLEARVREGRFRDDLFYRLNVVPLHLPPLREREGDIPLLARHFLAKYSRDRELAIPAELLEAMERCSWPGNVRQLENHLARAVAFAGKEKCLRREHLIPADAQGLPRFDRREEEEEPLRPLAQVLKKAEQEHLEKVLEHTGGHRSKSAEILGISRKTLWEKMKEAGLK
jgi:transcriptional regulator with PAS, ATPase and Fis domain